MKRLFTSLCVLAASFVGAAVASAQIYHANEDFTSASDGDNTTTTGSSKHWGGTDQFTVLTITAKPAVYQAGGSIRLGSGSNMGGIETPALNLSTHGGNFVVEFDVKGFGKSTKDKTTGIITTTGQIESRIKVAAGAEAQYVSYEATIVDKFEHHKLYFTNGQADTKVKITSDYLEGKTSGGARAFLDNIKIYPAYEVKVSSAKYATLATDKAYVLPSNLTGNVVTVSGQTASVTPLAPQAKVAAQQGILLKGDEGTYYMQIAEEGETFANNELKPALENGTISVAGKKHYILANDPTKGIGFYFQGESGDGSSVSNLAGKAYLAVDANVAPTQGFSFSDIVSSIEAATVAPAKNEVYDLSGRRVSAPVKGLYIVNGKKVIR